MIKFQKIEKKIMIIIKTYTTNPQFDKVKLAEFLSRGILDFKYVYVSEYTAIGSETRYLTLYLDFRKTYYFYPKREQEKDYTQVYKKISKAMYNVKYKKSLVDWYDICDHRSIKLPPTNKICDVTFTYFDFVNKDTCLFNNPKVDVLCNIDKYVYKSSHYEKLKENFLKKRNEKYYN